MKNSIEKITLFWFRRDLRLADNHALYRALRDSGNVLPLFIFDEDILKKLPDDDARVKFIHQEVSDIKKALEKKGSSILVMKGRPEEVFRKLMKEYSLESVYANHDYEPYAAKRDRSIAKILGDVPFRTFKDQVIFEKDEILKDDGDPYVVFTPYSRKWLDMFNKVDIGSFPLQNVDHRFLKTEPLPFPSLEETGFSGTKTEFPSRTIDRNLMKNYDKTRDFPAKNGTTRLGLHLRFGTLSIRELALIASELNKTYLNELIWREFYMMILWHFPHVEKESFHRKYDRLAWVNNEEHFRAWCEGKTGYPMVDAGMRQLNETGYMHNRSRMITASFLTKHLLTDWRWGEAYFAEKLLDYELSSNNGGWQWAAGTGTDAAPYFRIFNPFSQAEKFDPGSEYIRYWIPEYDTKDYPNPIIEHKEARNRALEAYRKVSGNN